MEIANLQQEYYDAINEIQEKYDSEENSDGSLMTTEDMDQQKECVASEFAVKYIDKMLMIDVFTEEWNLLFCSFVDDILQQLYEPYSDDWLYEYESMIKKAAEKMDQKDKILKTLSFFDNNPEQVCDEDRINIINIIYFYIRQNENERHIKNIINNML